jgi:hypothetical protein
MPRLGELDRQYRLKLELEYLEDGMKIKGYGVDLWVKRIERGKRLYLAAVDSYWRAYAHVKIRK